MAKMDLGPSTQPAPNLIGKAGALSTYPQQSTDAGFARRDAVPRLRLPRSDGLSVLRGNRRPHSLIRAGRSCREMRDHPF